jgi:hypothetical protein
MIREIAIHPIVIHDREEEQAGSALPVAETSYAKDCIPMENNCNVTVVTGGSDGGLLVAQRLRWQNSRGRP